MGLAHLKAIEEHVSVSCNCPHPPLKELVFGDGILKGSTPFLLACHFGELDSVKHMIKTWQVDVQAAGTYYLDTTSLKKLKKRIERASPLFVAAFRGHSRIVSHLLEEGADVSARTVNARSARYDDLSPLYGAVAQSSHYNYYKNPNPREYHREKAAIILSLLNFGAEVNVDSFRPSDGRPMWVMSCGAEATVALVNHGLDLNRRDSEGGSLLKKWCNDLQQVNNTDVVFALIKLLLEKGADPLAPDIYGLSPLLYVATHFYCRPATWTVLDLFLEKIERDGGVGNLEKLVHALELIGARILLKTDQASSLFPKAFEYWRRALRLRLQMQAESSSDPHLNNNLIEKKSEIAETVGWRTMEELENVIQHPSKYLIQSVLIQLKITSRTGNWDVVRSVIRGFNENTFFPSANQLEKVIGLEIIYSAMLDTILLFDPTEADLWSEAANLIFSVVETFVCFAQISPVIPTYDLVEKALRLIVSSDGIRLANGSVAHHRYKMIILIFINVYICLRAKSKILEGGNSNYNNGSFVTLLRQLDPLLLGSMLLVACDPFEESHHKFSTIELLLEGRPDLGATIEDGGDCDGPLHLVARSDHEDSEAMGCLLLSYGAQLNRTNKAGMTAVDIWMERNSDESGLTRPLPDWCLAVPKLKFLCARVVRANEVPYSKLPNSLRRFVDKP